MGAVSSIVAPFYNCGKETKLKNYTEEKDFYEIDLADKI